jgi:membrane protease YdiL (CAAX protease family)
MLRRYRLPFFFVLAFLLSWYPWIIALLKHKQTGPNPLGPLVAAIVITAMTEGRSGLKILLRRLIQWRARLSWYAAVFLIPIGTCLLAAALTTLFGAPMPSLPDQSIWSGMLDRFIFILLFIGLGEETGWRGYALPQLQQTRSPLIASLILAPIWALWHLPLFGLEIHSNTAIPFLIGVFSATILGTWIFNGTRGSVLLQMLFHTTVNTVGAGLIFTWFQGRYFTMLWWIYSGLWLTIALAILKIRAAEFKRSPLPEHLTTQLEVSRAVAV